METTLDKIDFGKKRFPLLPLALIIIVFAVILMIMANSKYSEKITAEFNDCFSKYGVKNIYLSGNKRFGRTCELPDGSIILQIVHENPDLEGDWILDKTYVLEHISDIRGTFAVELYPNDFLQGFLDRQIRDLLTLLIK